MGKKILAIMLSTLLLGSTTFFAPLYAGNTTTPRNYAQKKTTTRTKSPKKPEDEEKNSSTAKDIALGTLGVLVPGVIIASILYNIWPSNNHYIKPYDPIDSRVGVLRTFNKSYEVIPGDSSNICTVPDEWWNELNTFSSGTVPLRAFHWHNNLCWLYSSLLLFYYNAPTRVAILRFPASEATKLLNDENAGLTDKDKANLNAMVYLSKIFAALQGARTATGPRVLDLDERFEEKAVKALNEAFIKNGSSEQHNYGELNIFCARGLMGVLQQVSLINCSNNSQLALWIQETQQQLDALTLKTSEDKDFSFPIACILNKVDAYFEINPTVAIFNNQHGHYYLAIILDNKYYKGRYITIGESTTAGEEFAIKQNLQ